MEEKPICDECGGKSVEFRGSGKTLQFMICRKIESEMHRHKLTYDECMEEVRKMRNLHAPRSGRFG